MFLLLRLRGKRRQMLASPRREIHTPAIARLFPNTRHHSPGKKRKKETTPVLHVFFFFLDLTAADIRVSSQGTKNLAFSNDLLIFPEEQADMHV